MSIPDLIIVGALRGLRRFGFTGSLYRIFAVRNMLYICAIGPGGWGIPHRTTARCASIWRDMYLRTPIREVLGAVGDPSRISIAPTAREKAGGGGMGRGAD